MLPTTPHQLLPRSVLRALVLVLGLALTSAGGVLAAANSAVDQSTAAAAPTGDFSINLYRKGDFVSQATPYWCIGASMQMMLNIIGVTDDDSRAAQEDNMLVARSQGDRRRTGEEQAAPAAGGSLRGAGSGGWARGLGALGGGAYRERAVDGYEAALRLAAGTLRKTGRPVGLIVWRGAHAWVMSGFTATADPLVDSDYLITGLYIQDPWYPRVSSIWGPGQRPNSYISIRALSADFLPRRGGRRHAELAGKYVLVIPVDPAASAARYNRLI